MQNQIWKLETTQLETQRGIANAIMVAIDVGDKEQLGRFMPEVVDKIKSQRMCSPPDTSLLLITLIGELSAQEFKRLWEIHTENDVVMGFFMSQMQIADVVYGTSEGIVLDTVSLIEEEAGQHACELKVAGLGGHITPMDDLAELKSRILSLLKQGRVEEANKLMPPIMVAPPDPAFLAEYARLFAGLVADEPGDAPGE